MGLVILLLLFAAMWFFTIRPQQQRLRQQRALIASLSVGDVVMTAGGMIGRVITLADDEVMLDVGRATPVEIRVARAAVSQRISPEQGVDGPISEG